MFSSMKKKKDMSEHEKSAKMGVLKDISSMASDAMGDKIKGLKKVTVASNDKTGLKMGLDKAKALLDKNIAESPEHESSEAPEMEASEGDEESEESPMHEKMESPEDESAEHMAMDKEPDMMSPEELDKQIEYLQSLKAKKESSQY